mmetsp:Transcript_93419/g.166214  ORF Transcript_93419/g.166214 Transcript_93419/m.166214 type:complete len:204 (+) Transcript_93419:52-663(+)|eukprot:CAMPEP_0197652270 /NCGR_PEP_ID=MMETSP1338-20131121/34345_1 /TAXON_ID=43686 ORGANISM="Pelagodinium beii, Strain RCC1491" /NCGR_SAMPLE_ID=MMETSP1338 /ASSEMBLY_ACC=CAM_ASM_000754 /LENGTH=203 /DNA_ID=CAMNT_0043227105 /DNA_START=48 /DNA_END=659 /DNA_ORIENTATION=-
MAVQDSCSYDHLFKLLLIGDSGVGKSNLTLRYVDGVYKDSCEATIGFDFKICSRYVDGKLIKMQIWDTAGQERFRTITNSFYRGSHGIVIVYDVTEPTSFEHVRCWAQEILKYADGAAMLLVGNKVDLADKRRVPSFQGAELAEELGVGFLETSARNSENVDKAFASLVQVILQKHASKAAEQPQPTPGTSLRPSVEHSGCCQ